MYTAYPCCIILSIKLTGCRSCCRARGGAGPQSASGTIVDGTGLATVSLFVERIGECLAAGVSSGLWYISFFWVAVPALCALPLKYRGPLS